MKLHDVVQQWTRNEAPSPEASDPADPLASLLSMVDIPREPDEADKLKAKVPGIELPVLDMQSVRKAADRLNLAIFPLEALSSQSWEAEDRRMQNAIRGFGKVARGAGLVPFALSPAVYFDLASYVSLPGRPPCYGGGKASAFTALHLTADMLGGMNNEIGALRKSVDALAAKQAADMESTTRAIRHVERRVEHVEAAVKKERGTPAEVAPATWRAFIADKRWARVRPCDPLLFAIDGDDVVNSRVALAGPCWGPDIDPQAIKQMAMR